MKPGSVPAGALNPDLTRFRLPCVRLLTETVDSKAFCC